MSKTYWTPYHCKVCDHRWNVDDNNECRTQVTCNYPKFVRTDAHAKEYGIEVGGTFSNLCPKCGAEGFRHHKGFTATLGGVRCSHACQEAEGGSCKCICGGLYHGIASI